MVQTDNKIENHCEHVNVICSCVDFQIWLLFTSIQYFLCEPVLDFCDLLLFLPVKQLPLSKVKNLDTLYTCVPEDLWHTFTYWVHPLSFRATAELHPNHTLCCRASYYWWLVELSEAVLFPCILLMHFLYKKKKIANMFQTNVKHSWVTVTDNLTSKHVQYKW